MSNRYWINHTSGHTDSTNWGTGGYKMDSNILTEEKKQHIDSLGVYDLLSKVRFAPAGDPWMCGEVGAYWLKKLREKKEEDNAYYVKVSKEIGWKA